MCIHGLLPHLGQGERISLAKLSSQQYTTHNRPFRLAIDISIWLFQIQSGKGGSNPALRTFYYRLLRLLSLNIHPLFVFDGPNKPLFKRNKKVGGPGVKVATVPEFLAKQLLKEFGFPWHVAPGEAEAECALLQRQAVVDAVLSEDVDTLMFGSGITLRNWSQEGTAKGNKPPTHVNVYRAQETMEKSRGIDREGMILVALMSGGDYIPEGVPGVGAKVACDAARAGFGKELCALHRKDVAGLKAWKERLESEIRTNGSKFFSRKNTGFVMPEDFPSREVLGYYTHPCVSNPEKVERLRKEVKWDLEIDFAALRSFAADAFDWRCRGGAKKFIKNLAPALLIRELRRKGETTEGDQEVQMANEEALVSAIHGKRNHVSVDGELEYRISFTPSSLVPIDLSLEEEDNDFLPAGGVVNDESDTESELVPSSTQAAADDDSEAPVSPSKKRQFRPYDPDVPEKLWILRSFLRAGCPLLVEDYEASTQDPREFLKARRKAKAASKKDSNIHAPKQTRKKKVVEKEVRPENVLTTYARVTKAGSTSTNDKASDNNRIMKPLSPRANARSNAVPPKIAQKSGMDDEEFAAVAAFKLPSTQIPASLLREHNIVARPTREVEVLDLAMSSPAQKSSRFPAGVDPLRPFAAFTTARPPSGTMQKQQCSQKTVEPSNTQRTPKRTSRKRPSPELSSPALSQRTITSYYSPSPGKPIRNLPLLTQDNDIVDLVSSSPEPFPHIDEEIDRPLTATPRAKSRAVRHSASPTPRQRPTAVDETAPLPDTVTKRRRKEPLKRWQTEPVGIGWSPDEADVSLSLPVSRALTPQRHEQADATILISSSPAQGDEDLLSPSKFMPASQSCSEGNNTKLIRNAPIDPSLLLEQRIECDWQQDFAGEGGFLRDEDASQGKERPPSSYPTPLSMIESADEDLPQIRPRSQPVVDTVRKATKTKPRPSQAKNMPHKAAKNLKTRITLRESLEGAWKEIQVDAQSASETAMLDMTGDGSGWKKSGGKAEILGGWRKSGVEVLDLTGT